MAKGDYTINNIYQGGYNTFEPSSDNLFIGYRAKAGELGANTKPDTANQIQQVSQLLNQGIVPIELTPLQVETFNQIPKQHFKEINRMAKLTGAKISLHAPIVEASGIGEQGWSEANRQLAENQLKSAVEKAMELEDNGKVPVTIHSSAILGSEYKKDEKGNIVPEKIVLVNQENGKPVAVAEEEIKYYPEEPGLERKYSPEDQLKVINHSQWIDSLSKTVFDKTNADRILDEHYPIYHELKGPLLSGKLKPEQLEPSQRDVFMRIEGAQEYLKNAEMGLNALFDKAYKYASSDEEKKDLREAAEKYRKALGYNGDEPTPAEMIRARDPLLRSRASQVLINALESANPQLMVPIEEFAMKNSAKTFGNVAFDAYKKSKEKNLKEVPTISIENMFPGMAFSSAKDMDNLITKSRENFVKTAVADGMSESSAKQQASKIIGMTLDVGHLNIAKKKGFEDKDLMKEVEQIAKHVKHVHLTDNFGHSDSHLPVGMGNVPTKEIMEHLEKQGFKGTKIIEAGGWVQHFGTSPLAYNLEALGSPVYAEGPGPYWNQTPASLQGYSGGYGMMLPQTNYQTFGAGFSQLPADLGGQVGGGQGSRMSGRPME